MSAAMLEVADLAKSYAGLAAIDGVSFAVAAAEVVALIGPNGAGKTTTFDMINGQTPADRGRVRLAGEDILGLPPDRLWRLGMARTFQIAATFTSLTVAENVAVAIMMRSSAGLWSASPPSDTTLIEARRRLDAIGIGEMADQHCGALAYGDLKRVELAMALVNEPRLLLMDEPTAGMGPAERDRLMRLAVSMARGQGTAILFTEHDMDVVFGHADRILVLDRGRVIASGAPEAIRGNPEVRRVYLGGGTTSGVT